MAAHFQEEDIPISVFGLERGVMRTLIPVLLCSTTKSSATAKKAIEELQKMRYKVNLWQHCYTHPSLPIYDSLFPYSGSHDA